MQGYSSGINRRGFIAGMGLAAVGAIASAGLAGCQPSATSSSESENDSSSSWRDKPTDIASSDIVNTYECEILVVGLGHAGCTALRAAAESGAQVIGMELQEEESMTFRSSGGTGHINSEFSKSRDIPEADVDEFVNDWMLRSGNRANYTYVLNYAKNCGAAFDWLFDGLTQEEIDAITVMYWPSDQPSVKEYSGLKTWVGACLMGDYQESALKRCIQIATDAGNLVLYGTSICQLITDDEGAVVGAIGEGPEGYVQVNASKGVIISTGGFGGNAEMCADLLYETAELMGESDSFGNESDCDGAGIKAGYWAGAQIDPSVAAMDGSYWYPGGTRSLIGPTAALRLNAHGERYSNEGFGSSEPAAIPGMRQPRGNACVIFDEHLEEQLKVQPIGNRAYDYANTDFAETRAVLDKAYEGKERGSADEESSSKEGVVFAADDYETLGTYLGYTDTDLQQFVASIERYNELCEKGIDEDFGKDPALMFPIDKPPYYGLVGSRSVGSNVITVSGLLVDGNGQVLNRDFEPIKGLYAAGNAAGGRFGWQYSTGVPGESLSMAQTMGRFTASYIASL